MKLPQILLTILLSAAVAFVTSTYIVPRDGSATSFVKESVYDRVMRTGTIRCGYGLWNPSLMKDPNTGQFSGIVYDYVEALGHALNLKIDWAEETAWGDFPVALESGRIDAMCAGVWHNPKRSRVIDYVSPLYYVPFMAYARVDDARFDNNLDAINSPEVTVTMTDGESSSLIADVDFPKVKKVELPKLTEGSVNFLNVADRKADVYLNDLVSFYDFNARNPGKLKIIPSSKPLRLFGVSIATPREQEGFRRMLDNATAELSQNGVIEKIIKKYEKYPNSFYLASKPYEQVP
jgi:polar amino acid transport system substrate-binding protein